MLKLKIFLVLFYFGFGLRLNIIGNISISEIFLLIFFVYFVFVHNKYWQIQKYMLLTLLYFALLVFQIISEVVVGNDVNNAMRGIAVTIVSFCHVTFLLWIFLKDRNLIFWLLLGRILRMLILSNQITESNSFVEDETAVYLKFYLAPLVNDILAIITICIMHKKALTFIYMLVGIFFVIYGARSAGLITFLAGLGSCLLLSGKRIDIRKLNMYIGFSVIICYGLYVIYVNSALQGDLSRGNINQIKDIVNPYNPISLLERGRPETFVGWIAFMDKPIFGHGSWAKDNDYKYHKLMLKEGEKINKMTIGPDIIPAHSILIGLASSNGIFAFVCIVAILIFFLKCSLRLVTIYDPLKSIILYQIFSVVWDFLFSPVTHFRWTVPLSFAFILATSLLYERNLRQMAGSKNFIFHPQQS